MESECELTAARVVEPVALPPDGLSPFETRDADLEAYNDAATNFSKSTYGSAVRVDASVPELRDLIHKSRNNERIRRSARML